MKELCLFAGQTGAEIMLCVYMLYMLDLGKIFVKFGPQITFHHAFGKLKSV